MASKAVASLVGGAAFGIAGAASAYGASAVVLRFHGEHLVFDGESLLIVLGVFAVCALAAPWGMLIGWIVRSQTGALGGIMAYTLIAESAIIALSPSVGRFLPGGAESSIFRDFASGETLGWPWGFVLFTGWIALAAVAATLISRRRDLT
jgi:ABC-2 type transport system permease protein